MRVSELKANRVVVEAAGLVNHAGTQLATAVVSTDGTFAGNSDTEVPSEKAVKTYVDTAVAADNQTGKVIDPDGLAFAADEVTESGALSTASFIQLNSELAALAMTKNLAEPGRLLVITQTDAGTEGHTVTLSGATFDGTNDIATFDAAGETLVLFGVSATRFVIVANIGSVGLSASGG